MIFPVIMAGGRGERLWPRSRAKLPKQFLSFLGEQTLVQTTVSRLEKLVPAEKIFIVTGREYVSTIKQQVPHLSEKNIIIEPIGKNTAACIGLAALYLERVNSDAVMAVFPSDHMIWHKDKFLANLQVAAELAKKEDCLVTLGIPPVRPETGYGYIKLGNDFRTFKGHSIYRVERFIEKPDLNRAKAYLNSGQYLWNTGMFLWKISVIRKMIKQFMPDLYRALERIKAALGTSEEEIVLAREFQELENISVDYGIMEKADRVFVVPGDFGWDDLGNWIALGRVHQPDSQGNIFQGDVINVDSTGCIAEGSGRLVALVGVQNLLVVDTDDALLVCAREKVQDIKELLKKLKEENREEYL
ncbi:MAG: mannose-1-phosphate guanylyltransferase [Desulfitobacteriaceae bacterium]|nr:mannose-1-phosphate guanylyltransferase [Desulfitobacteriaceae bacterium]